MTTIKKMCPVCPNCLSTELEQMGELGWNVADQAFTKVNYVESTTSKCTSCNEHHHDHLLEVDISLYNELGIDLLTNSSIWSDAPNWASAVAMNRNGYWHYYSAGITPDDVSGRWIRENDERFQTVDMLINCDVACWTESHVQKPIYLESK